MNAYPGWQREDYIAFWQRVLDLVQLSIPLRDALARCGVDLCDDWARGQGEGEELEQASLCGRVHHPWTTFTPARAYPRCFATSLVISNMVTCFLPPKTAASFSSALIIVRFLASWRPFFLI